ncbi:MAG: metallophosphoesterase, partial [Candidatus Omnitrophica bacterium]|nr:metallophosphoesterase [Candidatus Omnitrophota bacterium]
MRLIHTADWQIGMRAAHVGEAGETVRKGRTATLSKILELAKEHRVDLILVAGDSFEDNGVDRILVQKVIDALRLSPVPIYFIPGNHDPFVPGSVWDYPSWRQVDNLHVLTETEPVSIPGGTLYPCPLFEKHSRKDPTSWIQPKEGEGIRIGLGHGTVEGIPQDEPDYPIA